MRTFSIFSLLFIVLILAGCDSEPKTSQDAREKLVELKIPFKSSRFLRYVKKGDIKMVKLFRLAGMPLYSEDRKENTSLVIAINSNQKEMIQYILKNTVMSGNFNMIDKQNKKGKSALIIAIEKQDINLMESLLKHGGNPNLWDKNFDQGTHIALKLNNYKLLKKLLDYKITDINGKNGSSETPLMLAIKENKKDIVALLLSKNANPDISSIGNITPMLMATENENIDVIKMLIKAKAATDVYDVRGKTPLMVAIQKNNLDIIDILLFSSADVNFHKKGLKTPLQEVLTAGNINKDVLFVLLANGAKIPEGEMGIKIVSEAINSGDIDIIKTIVENSNIGDMKIDYDNLVTYSLKNGNEEIAVYFMKHSKNPNEPNSYQVSPLELAIPKEYLEATKYLISKGADVTKKTKKGYKIFDLAFKTNNLKLSKLILKSGAEINADRMLLKAIIEGKEELISLLLEYGAKPNSYNSQGQPFIWLAAAKGSKKGLIDLINNGAKVDTPDKKDKMTPLAISSSFGYVKTTKILLQNKANPNFKDLRGFTPLTHAVLNLQLPAIQMLLKAGANVNIRDAAGRSIFEINEDGSGQKWRTYKGDIREMLMKAR